MEPQQDNTQTNWFLAFLTGAFAWIEQSTADELYNWIFRGMTLLSLALIIIINWKKAWLTLFPKKVK